MEIPVDQMIASPVVSVVVAPPPQPVLPSFDLTNVRHRVRMDHPDWAPERVEVAIHGYREFMALAKANKGRKLVPMRDVDQVWHAHLLHTRHYARCCEEFAGFFIHLRRNCPAKMPSTTMAKPRRSSSTRRSSESNIRPWSVPVGVRPQAVWTPATQSRLGATEQILTSPLVRSLSGA